MRQSDERTLSEPLTSRGLEFTITHLKGGYINTRPCGAKVHSMMQKSVFLLAESTFAAYEMMGKGGLDILIFFFLLFNLGKMPQLHFIGGICHRLERCIERINFVFR